MERIYFTSGYGGATQCHAEVDGKKYVIEMDEIIDTMEKHMSERGYTTSKTNRQKYERLHINA